jgi:hypothetical protein
MSIFKTEVPEGIVLSSDSVVSATIDPNAEMRLPGLKKTSEMDVQNTKPGAVRRKSGES